MNRSLDKFYTTPATVTLCYQALGDLTRFDALVEPSAGAGAFLLPSLPLPIQAYDLNPDDIRITQADFLTLPVPSIQQSYQRILTLGNPPFGTNSSLALAFLRKAMEYSSVVAFILPRSFKKVSLQAKVPLTFELHQSLELPPSSFLLDGHPYDVPCVFQIWVRASQPRTLTPLRIASPLFTFVTPLKAQFSIRRVGSRAGYADLSVAKAMQSHYFLQLIEGDPIEWVEGCNQIQWEHGNTTGPRSISKGELVAGLETWFQGRKIV